MGRCLGVQCGSGGTLTQLVPHPPVLGSQRGADAENLLRVLQPSHQGPEALQGAVRAGQALPAVHSGEQTSAESTPRPRPRRSYVPQLGGVRLRSWGPSWQQSKSFSALGLWCVSLFPRCSPLGQREVRGRVRASPGVQPPGPAISEPPSPPAPHGP